MIEVPLNHVDLDQDGKFTPGDCLKLPSDILEQLDMNEQEAQSSVGEIPGTGLFGSFVTNSSCGGLTITSVEQDQGKSKPASTYSPPANFTCPPSQAPVLVTISDTPEARITTTTARGAGKPVHSCSQYGDDWELDGGLCYPPCPKGFSGVGPLCLTDCPASGGWRNDGLHCLKPASFGRGAGKIHQCPGCERNGLLWYPKCGEGFAPAGCCVCSPVCPSGMHDIGVSCQKGSHGRGVGLPLGCAPGEDYDAGLCYPPCPPGANGAGPLCYAPCTDDQPHRLGIWCFHDEDERNKILGAIIGGVLGGAIIVGAATAIALPLILPLATTAAAGPAFLASGSLSGSVIVFTPVASLSLSLG